MTGLNKCGLYSSRKDTRQKYEKTDGQSTGGGKIHDTSTIKICDNDSGLWFHE